MNPQILAQQQRYAAQQQAQYASHGHRPSLGGHPQQMAHGHPGQPGHPPQHLQHLQHLQHAQHGQHLNQRRPMGTQQARPRTAQPPVMDPAAHLAELQARHERSLSAAKRPTDQTIPDGVEDNIVGDGVAQYKRMRDVERRLDAITMRKMMGIEQEVEIEEENGPVNPLMEVTRRQYRTMRIWITNTAENQPWQGTTSLDENAFDFNTGADPRYRVKIVGKIIDSEKSDAKGNGHAGVGVDLDDEALFDDPDSEEDEDAMDEEHEKDVQLETNGASTADKSHPEAQIAKILERLESKNPPMKLSHCFERINVDYDRSQTLQTDTSNLVEWNRPETWNVANPPPGADFDTLEFERKSDENLHCTIHLHRQSHGLFKLSPPLADLLQMKEASRAEVIRSLWQYIHLSRLPQEEDKGLVQCDEALKTVFGVDIVNLKRRMNEHLNHHMTPVPPHSLPYTIRVDSDFQTNPQPTIYDIPIPDPLPSLTTPPPSLSRIALHSLVHSSTAKLTTGAIAQRDALQAETVSALQASRARYAFFSTLSLDPVTFVRRWIASQQRDLEVILGDARFGNPDQDVPDHERWMADEFRQGGDKGVWASEGVRESVGLMIRGQRS